VSTSFLVIAIPSALWGVVGAILIAAALDRRGIPVNMILFRMFPIRDLSLYRDTTQHEAGKVGPLHYSYIVAMNLALVSAVIGLILRMR